MIRIQWLLGNHCNYNCSYCPIELKSGTVGPPDDHRFKAAFNEIVTRFDNFSLEFQGGEPTFYKPLIDCIIDSDINRERQKICLHTNGSLDIDIWQKIIDKISRVELTIHPEYAQTSHITRVLDLFLQHGREIAFKIPALAYDWTKTVNLYRKYKFSGASVNLQMLYTNYTKGNNQYYDYTPDQWEHFYELEGINIRQEPEVEKEQPTYKKMHNLNNFYGHMCQAGLDQFVIMYNGDLYRGWCRSGGSFGNLYDLENLNWPVEGIICPKEQCYNGFDLQSKKSQGSWGMK